MARRLNDDEVMDYVYSKMFGDMDKLESGAMFDEKDPLQSVTDNAQPQGMSGINIEVKPLMASASEGARPSTEPKEEEEDKLKGIGSMSPLMAQLHGDR